MCNVTYILDNNMQIDSIKNVIECPKYYATKYPLLMCHVTYILDNHMQIDNVKNVIECPLECIIWRILPLEFVMFILVRWSMNYTWRERINGSLTRFEIDFKLTILCIYFFKLWLFLHWFGGKWNKSKIYRRSVAMTCLFWHIYPLYYIWFCIVYMIIIVMTICIYQEAKK